jgi:hypothetical protein
VRDINGGVILNAPLGVKKEEHKTGGNVYKTYIQRLLIRLI